MAEQARYVLVYAKADPEDTEISIVPVAKLTDRQKQILDKKDKVGDVTKIERRRRSLFDELHEQYGVKRDVSFPSFNVSGKYYESDE